MVWAFVAIAFVLVAALASAPQALTEDGPLLVDQLVRAEGLARWYHAAYLPIGQALSRLPGVDGEVHALALASALASVGALALAAAATRRLGGAPWIAVGLLLGSSAWWVNASRVEVHGQQLLGAAVLVWAAADPALFGSRRRAGRAACLLLLAGWLAVISHRTNVALIAVPFCLWIGRGSLGRVACLTAAVALGGALGEVTNRAMGVLRSERGGATWLMENFRKPFSWEFVVDELVVAWLAPLLVGVLCVAAAAREGRSGARLVAGALPLLCFFLWFGVWTSGGYFGSAMLVFAIAAAVSAPRLRRRTGLAVLVAVPAVLSVVAGVVHGVNTSWSEARHAFDALATERVDHYRAHLELPVHVVQFAPDQQSVTGRVSGLVSHNLFGEMVDLGRAGATPQAYAQRTVEFARELVSGGERLALDGSWRAWGDVDPRVALYMDALESAFVDELDAEWVGGEGVLLLVDALDPR